MNPRGCRTPILRTWSEHLPTFRKLNFLHPMIRTLLLNVKASLRLSMLFVVQKNWLTILWFGEGTAIQGGLYSPSCGFCTCFESIDHVFWSCLEDAVLHGIVLAFVSSGSEWKIGQLLCFSRLLIKVSGSTKLKSSLCFASLFFYLLLLLHFVYSKKVPCWCPSIRNLEYSPLWRTATKAKLFAILGYTLHTRLFVLTLV